MRKISLKDDLMEIRAILLMGGLGERFGSARPKQFHLIAGKKTYLHTLERFLESGLFQEILLIAPLPWIEEVQKDIKEFSKNVRVIEGGSTRQESSFLGIFACPDSTDIVVIHDAVRPFVSKRILEENIAKAIEFGAADTCIPSADTLVYAPDGQFIENIPIRAEYLRGQTPQSFNLPLIRKAHLHARMHSLEGVSDDCRLAKEIGATIAIVQGEESNIKITTPQDVILAEQLLRHGEVEEIVKETRNLRGMKIAISGGTGGIGQALTKLLEQEGAHPILLSRSTEFAVDFLDAGSIKSCFTSLEQQVGPLDGLVNCAGQLDRGSLHELSEEQIDAQIDVNFRGVIFACKHACLKEGGQIINVASSSYARGRGDIAVYAASKAAIVNFSQGFAQERPDLIVNVVAPARTDTLMRRAQFPEENRDLLLSPEEVAEEILDLLRRPRKFENVAEIRR